MRRTVLLALILGFLAASLCGQGGKKTEADLPAPARKILAALNAGRRDVVEKTLREEFHPRAFVRMARDKYAEALFEVARDGGVEVRQVWAAEASRGVAVLTTKKPVPDFLGRTAVRWLYFETVLASPGDAQAGKVEDFTLQAIPNPEASADPALDFPKTAAGSSEAAAAEIRKRIERMAAEDRFSGTILIAEGDRVLWQGAFGEADKNHRVPNAMDSVFHMASATKMFTSVAIGQLVEAGRLRFDSRLSEAWPGYPNPAVAAKITIGQILSHTSGLGEGLVPEVQRADTPYRTLKEAVEFSAAKPLLFEPGSQWSYSNLGFMVLGRVIETLAGMSYEEYVERHILKPAGMTRTGNYDLTTVIPGLAIGYGRQADDPLGVRERHSYWPLVLGFRGTSAGGYYSTAPDMFRFLRALRTYRLTGRRTADLLTSGKYPLSGGRQYAYGFWDAALNGQSVRGHGGGGLGYGINTEVNTFWAPGGESSDFAVVILSNYDPPAAQDFNKAALESLSRQKRR